MESQTFEVTAPSRLHFGLLSFGAEAVRQYGGAGVMIDRPALRLRFGPGRGFEAEGTVAPRILALARLWAQWRGVAELPACRIAAAAAPRLHVGLGIGTQLALAVATGLDAYCGFAAAPLWQTAVAMKRGLRSAVGTYGFAHGGLIAECGKLPNEQISPLERRVELPPSWRFVLFCPRHETGLHGQSEREVFAALPAVSPEVAEELKREMRDRMLPAAAARQFAAFSESVYRFGHQAGLCYATIQGGAYNGEAARELVHRIRGAGTCGAGQSSWGPTIYAICRDAGEASRLVQRLTRERSLDDLEVTITPPANKGARLRTLAGR